MNTTHKKTKSILILLVVVTVILITVFIYAHLSSPILGSNNPIKESTVPTIQSNSIITTSSEYDNSSKNTDNNSTIDVVENAADEIVRDEYGQAIWDVSDSKKVVYLTFDDGPSELTPLILDVLKQYDVHATFFVVYNPDCEAYYKREVEEGHAIQVHTASHKLRSIYSSLDAYMDDFWTIHDYIQEITGVYPMYFRFPGGSNNNCGYPSGMTAIIARKMSEKGFQFVDWTTSTGDGN